MAKEKRFKNFIIGTMNILATAFVMAKVPNKEPSIIDTLYLAFTLLI
jgi:hypothetical protein